MLSNSANMTRVKLNAESETVAQLFVLPFAYNTTLPVSRRQFGALQMFVIATTPALETATSAGNSWVSLIVILGAPV